MRSQIETRIVDKPSSATGRTGQPEWENKMQPSFSSRFMNLIAAFAAGAIVLAATGSDASAAARMVARISISDQTMQITIDGRKAHEWKVSTAARGYVTPTGSFKPTRMHEMWYSRKYDMAPMPHSVFFHGGYAVHATDAIKRLGRPASHGCIRLHPNDASDFYRLVETVGPANTSIVIVK
jgi:lipoprotein-anchoring transpeptidase ErfK/SrfK